MEKLCVVLGGMNDTCISIAKTFAIDKCNIAFMDSNKQVGKEIKNEIEHQYDVKCFFFHGDPESQEDLEFFVGGIIGQFGMVDFFINNAIIYASNNSENCCFEKMKKVFHLGVTVPFLFTQLCKDNFREDASIVNIITSTDHDNERLLADDFPLRGTMESFMSAITILLEGKIRINCVTNGYDENRMCQEEKQDIDHTILFLCKKRSDFINCQIINIDGALIQTYIEYNQGGWDIKK
ncbi:MAG TPA: SDR family oxidoreductase [Lachnospiraceae bacterium]|nr:SDR family oxidoreductase [Lachnospiraceae bacterium]